MTQSSPHSRFCLLTYPRTASNLLIKILNLDGQPDFASCDNGGYFFAPLNHLRYDMGTAGARMDDLTSDQRVKETACIHSCVQALTRYIHNAEIQDKKALFKEHTHILTSPVAQTRFLSCTDSIKELFPSSQCWKDQSPYNETLLPDIFLNTLKPTFLIRHPALAFPSYYRAARKADGDRYLHSEEGRRMCRNIMTLRWTRQLYIYYARHFGASDNPIGTGIVWPLVLDADDIMTQPAVLTRFCDILGLDSTQLRYRWDTDQRKRRPGIMAFRSTIDGSTGIDVSKASGGRVDLDESARQWKEEFGVGPGEMIELYVREALNDYEFLRERRLRA